MQCDKKGRGGDQDPCSECRWFGGSNCKCALSGCTYNDQLWRQMITRASFGHNLAAPKPRDFVAAPGKPAPAPMPEEKLIKDWRGLTREQVMASPLDILPSGVRELPRAYVVPPRLTTQGKKNHQIQRNRRKKARTGRIGRACCSSSITTRSFTATVCCTTGTVPATTGGSCTWRGDFDRLVVGIQQMGAQIREGRMDARPFVDSSK